MNSFYICKTPRSPAIIQEKEKGLEFDCGWAVKVINKAALQIKDIRMKLDLAKITHFLTNQQKNQRQRPHLVTFCQSPTSDSQAEIIEEVREERLSQSMESEAQFLNVNLSQSAFSRELCNYSHCGKAEHSKLSTQQVNPSADKQNREGLITTKLQWRSVVTKNVLQECDESNRLQGYRERENQLNARLDEITDENILLKKCFMGVIKVLREVDIIQVEIGGEPTVEDMEGWWRDIEMGLPQQMGEIEQLRDSLKAILIQIQEYKEELIGKNEGIKELNALVQQKDEEIASLLETKSDLESRIAVLTKSQTPRKNYVKYFTDLQTPKFSSTTS